MAKKKAVRITKEIADKVLMLNCKDEDNIRRLKKSLMKLSMIKSEEDLQTDNLELIINKLESKYPVKLGYIMRTEVDGIMMQTGMLRADTPENAGIWLKTVHALTVWEVLAKSIFYLVYYIQESKDKG